MEQLKTFEDACKVEGLDPEKVYASFETIPELDKVALIAIAKLFIIVRAANRLINDGITWLPNWDNSSERKYYPWFYLDQPRGSSGFRFGDYVYWLSRSRVGSRLCFKNYETAEYIGNQFLDLYKDFMVIPQKTAATVSDRLKDLKEKMYKELLEKDKEELTEDEVDFLVILAKDLKK